MSKNKETDVARPPSNLFGWKCSAGDMPRPLSLDISRGKGFWSQEHKKIKSLLNSALFYGELCSPGFPLGYRVLGTSMISTQKAMSSNP